MNSTLTLRSCAARSVGILAFQFLAATFLLPTVTTAIPVWINFENLPGMDYWAGQPIPAEARLSNAFLDSYGVRFTSGSPYVAVVQCASGATSGVMAIGGTTPDGILTYNRAYPVVISFSGVTDSVSIRGDREGYTPLVVVLNAYDIDGSLIATTSSPDYGGETLCIAMPGIHSVEFLGAIDGDNYGVALDDLVFNPVTPQGACCFLAACEIYSPVDCVAHSGTYQGNGTLCVPDPCPTSSVGGESQLPSSLSLHATPNPTTGDILIQYDLPVATTVTLEIFSAGGSLVRRVEEGEQSAGRHTVPWNALDASGHPVPSGVYLARIRAGGEMTSCRLVLAR